MATRRASTRGGAAAARAHPSGQTPKTPARGDAAADKDDHEDGGADDHRPDPNDGGHVADNAGGDDGGGDGGDDDDDSSGDDDDGSSGDGSSSTSSDESSDSGDENASSTTHFHVRIRQLNPELTCTICRGYFREASTLTECQHTFCKSCILKRFALGFTTCPEVACGMDLGPRPIAKLKPDQKLQAIVNLMVPGVVAADLKAEKAFARKRSHATAAAAATAGASTVAAAAAGGGTTAGHHSGGDGGDRKRSAASGRGGGGGGDGKDAGGGGGGGARKKKGVRRDAILQDQISFELMPDTSVAEDMQYGKLKSPFLLTSNLLRIGKIKKHVAKHLGIQTPDMIELLCKGDILGSDLTLNYIKVSRWHDAQRNMVLHYRKKTSMY